MQGKRNKPRLPVYSMAASMTSLVLLSSLLSACSLLQSTGQAIGLLSPPASEAGSEGAASYEITLTLTGSDSMNPDPRTRPSPAQVRLFVTDPLSEISDRSFEEVFDYGGNVMDPRPLVSITLRPGEIRDVVLPADRSQTRLVVAVAYRNPYQSVWLAEADIVPQDAVRATAIIDAHQVSIQPTQ